MRRLRVSVTGIAVALLFVLAPLATPAVADTVPTKLVGVTNGFEIRVGFTGWCALFLVKNLTGKKLEVTLSYDVVSDRGAREHKQGHMTFDPHETKGGGHFFSDDFALDGCAWVGEPGKPVRVENVRLTIRKDWTAAEAKAKADAAAKQAKQAEDDRLRREREARQAHYEKQKREREQQRAWQQAQRQQRKAELDRKKRIVGCSTIDLQITDADSCARVNRVMSVQYGDGDGRASAAAQACEARATSLRAEKQRCLGGAAAGGSTGGTTASTSSGVPRGGSATTAQTSVDAYGRPTNPVLEQQRAAAEAQRQRFNDMTEAMIAQGEKENAARARRMRDLGAGLERTYERTQAQRQISVSGGRDVYERRADKADTWGAPSAPPRPPPQKTSQDEALALLADATCALVPLVWTLSADEVQGFLTKVDKDERGGARAMVACRNGEEAGRCGKDAICETALMVTAGRGDVAMLRALLQWGGNVDVRDARRSTALHWALRYGSSAGAAEALLAAGADPCARDQDGVTPAALASGVPGAGVFFAAAVQCAGSK